MNLPLWIICSITVSCLTVALAGENASSKKNNPKNQLKDDLTSDDEDGEGSGFGESGYDLESSGSGYGPDDEDAEHGTDMHSKSGHVRGNDHTIAVPASTMKSVSSASPPLPKHNAKPIPGFDQNSRENPVDTAPNEQKNNLSNINPYRGETENRALIPKKSEGETIFDNRHPDDKNDEDNKLETSGVYKVNTPDRDRATSFFAQPGILAAVIGGAVVGLLCAILVVMFIVYRMRKKDEGSYPLEEMKRCPASNPYMKPNHREFFA